MSMQYENATNAQSIHGYATQMQAAVPRATIASRLDSLEILLTGLEEQTQMTIAAHEKRLTELELRLG